MQIDGEVLVAGLGSIGERHVRNLLAAGHRDVSVLRRSPTPPRTLAPDSFVTITDEDEAFNRRPAALIIATPSSMHGSLLKRAVDAGIPTMVEVPVASSLDGLPAIAERADDFGVPVLVAHNLRFHPCLNEIRNALARRDIGPALYSQAQFGEYLPGGHRWEDYRGRYEARRDLGGGPILTSLHEIDHAIWLFGKAESVVCSTATRSLDIDVEDTAMMVITHRNGVLSQITLDFVQRPYRRWLQVVGGEGTLEWDFVGNRIQRYTAASNRWEEVFAAGDYSAAQTYVDEIEHFARVIKREEEPIVDLGFALHVLHVAVAAHESAATGRRIGTND